MSEASMSAADAPFPVLSAYRERAKRLLRDLRGTDPQRAEAAAKRFALLRSFHAQSTNALRSGKPRVQLRHALSVIAEEVGARSWLELKARVLALAARGTPSFHTPGMDALLNRWFVDHDEAAASLHAEGGYLLPFRTQMFITEVEGIRALGLDPFDPDWARVAFDLVEPSERAAAARIAIARWAAIDRGMGSPTSR